MSDTHTLCPFQFKLTIKQIRRTFSGRDMTIKPLSIKTASVHGQPETPCRGLILKKVNEMNEKKYMFE